MTYLLLALLFLPCAFLIAPRVIHWLRTEVDSALIEYRDNGFDENGERVEFGKWFIHRQETR